MRFHWKAEVRGERKQLRSREKGKKKISVIPGWWTPHEEGFLEYGEKERNSRVNKPHYGRHHCTHRNGGGEKKD